MAIQMLQFRFYSIKTTGFKNLVSTELNSFKDNSLSIFHACGKFLYNKREPIQEGMKPRFKYKHQNILDSTLLEPHVLTFYLHQNMLDHFDDIEDVSNCLQVYSEMDFCMKEMSFATNS